MARSASINSAFNLRRQNAAFALNAIFKKQPREEERPRLKKGGYGRKTSYELNLEAHQLLLPSGKLSWLLHSTSLRHGQSTSPTPLVTPAIFIVSDASLEIKTQPTSSHSSPLPQSLPSPKGSKRRDKTASSWSRRYTQPLCRWMAVEDSFAIWSRLS